MAIFRPLCMASLLGAVIASLPGSPGAQTPGKPVLRPQAASQLRVTLPARPLARHAAAVDGLRDNGVGALDTPLPEGWALSGFALSFNNGDHKLRRIGVMPGGRFVRFALADQNGDDPFSARAQFVSIPGIRVQQVVAEGGGKFEIPLPGEAPADSTLVLSGFEFRRADGTDANLRNIAVWAVPERNSIVVSLTDDQGMDFRGLEATLGAAVLNAVAPLPGIMETVIPIASAEVLQRASSHSIRRMAGRYRGYRVMVQYAWVPNARIQREGAMAGGSRRPVTPPSRIDALQGFDFTFNNSDHHLLSFAVNGDGNGGFRFQDNNTDDPIQWSVTYLTLRP